MMRMALLVKANDDELGKRKEDVVRRECQNGTTENVAFREICR